MELILMLLPVAASFLLALIRTTIYLIKESKGPKAVIAIKDLNATFQPEKIGHPHGLQLTYQEYDHTRNLYVYHESSEVGL